MGIYQASVRIPWSAGHNSQEGERIEQLDRAARGGHFTGLTTIQFSARMSMPFISKMAYSARFWA